MKLFKNVTADKDIYYEYVRLIDEYDKYFENADKFI